MLKKAVSIFLVICTFCFCLVPAAAKNEFGAASIRLNSNLDGCTEKDTERFIEIRSENVVYNMMFSGPVSVSDYSGTGEQGKLKAGRTYYVTYNLDAASGYELPEKLDDSNLIIECGKGVTVISRQISSAPVRNEDGSFTYIGPKKGKKK